MTARSLIEAHTKTVPPVVSEVAGDETAPSTSYRGVQQGLVNVLSLVDVLRARQFPGETTWTDTTGKDRTGAEADLAFAGLVGWTAANRTPRGPGATILMPFRVHLVIPTPDEDTVRGAISKRERARFTAAGAERTWRSRVTTNPEAVEAFYDQMHVPTMQARHAELARSESRTMAHHVAERGGLFLMEDSDGPVAGCLFTIAAGVMTTRLLGVAGGADTHYESGAFKALYYSMIRFCSREPSISSIDLFGTEAFMSKGIFQWKRKLGAQVRTAPNHFREKYLRLQINRDSNEVRRFLVANPVITLRSNGALSATVFHDEEFKPDSPVSTRIGGLSTPTAVDLDRFLARLPRRTPLDRSGDHG